MTSGAECWWMWTVTLIRHVGSLSMACEGQTEAETSPAFGELLALVAKQSGSAHCPVHLGVHHRRPHRLSQVGDAGRALGVSVCTQSPALPSNVCRSQPLILISS